MMQFPPESLRPDQPIDHPEQLPPLTLAYVGDAVYELYIRQRLLQRGHVRVKKLHEVAVGYVRARAQATALQELLPHLSELEAEVARRGRNAKGQNPRKVDPAEYAQATAFEALLGYLYLAGKEERLGELLGSAVRHLEAGGSSAPVVAETPSPDRGPEG
jgi:ribonuclease-3 family protein